MLIVNLNQDFSKESKYISNTLVGEITKNLENKKKSIIYLNRRGEYSSLICQSCQKIFKCKNCDISLSVHTNPDMLVCHMCGNIENEIKNTCDSCKNGSLVKIGVGTQQVEKTLAKLFGSAKIYRFDSDSVKNKSQKLEVLEKIESSDIIIGTKMITTGFNIKNVGLIAVVILEQELQSINYNAEEKLYSNIKQLIGRGKRLGNDAEIIIQSFVTDNKNIENIINSNYKDFFINILKERKAFDYPPYKDLVKIEVKNKDSKKAKIKAEKLHEEINKNNGVENDDKVFLSLKPFKKNSNFYYKILIKGKGLKNKLDFLKEKIIRDPDIIITFD